MNENDLSIEDLLNALEDISSGEDHHPRNFPEWLYSRTEINCVGCGRKYTGLMQHLSNSPFLGDKIMWCPKCISEQSERWWHHCLRMEGVEEIV